MQKRLCRFRLSLMQNEQASATPKIITIVGDSRAASEGD